VWQLSDPTTILVGSDAHNHHHPGDGGGGGDGDGSEGSNMERMLLVSEGTIERVWTPSQAKSVPDETFVAWLERRNVLSASVMAELDSGRTSPARHATRWNASAGGSQRARRGSFDEDDEVEDRAPVERVHESDEEEFTFQSTQPPVRSAAAFRSQPQLQRQVLQSQMNDQVDRPTPDPRSSGRVPDNATADQRYHSSTGAKASEQNTHALPVNANACSAGFSLAPQMHSTNRAVHQGLSASETLQASITPSSPRIDYSQAASYSNTSVTTVPHPPFAIPPIPAATERSPERANGIGASGTFGFSQFLSQPVNNPTIPQSQAKSETEPSVEPNTGMSPLPPLAGSQRRDSAQMSTKSKKRRRKRSSTDETDRRSPTNQTSPKATMLPSMLWSTSACNSSILEMFDDDDSNDAVESLFGARKSKSVAPIQTSDNARVTENSNNGIELPRQPSLFDVNVGLDDFFSDNDE
jgi:hypothetical protein